MNQPPLRAGDSLSLERARRLDDICVRFETAWQAAVGGAPPPTLEAFLAEADTDTGASLLRELVRVDLHYRLQAGEKPQPDDYRQRFPWADLTWLVEMPIPGDGTSLVIPGYEILGELGRGGMGSVYRARDIEMDREVAVKILQDRIETDSPTAARFVEEARITGQLQHPGIPAVYRVAKQPDGRPFLAMKLIKGRTLEEMLATKTPFNSLAIIEALAQTLGYAHAHNVIHRDVKPTNVMVGPFGEVQLMDWGLAKVLLSCELEDHAPTSPQTIDSSTVIKPARDGGDTEHGSVLGTPAYMSPEQAAGETDRVGPASDVFGLGALWCKLLTGRPPYAGTDAESVRRNAMRGKTEEALARLATCGADPEVVALCRQCLAFDPAARPADGNVVARQVAQMRVAAEERARQAELARARAEVLAAEQGRRRRMLLVGGGLITVVLTMGLTISLWQTYRATAAESKAKEERDAKDLALQAEKQARARAFAALRSMTASVIERKFAQGVVLTEDDRAFLRGTIAQFDAFAAIQADDADTRYFRAAGRTRVGLMRHRLGELKQAESDYREALPLLKQLAAEFPNRIECRQDLASTQTNLGLLLFSTQQVKQAEAALVDALAIQRQLTVDFSNRPEFRQELANGYNNLGNLLYMTQRRKEAEAAYTSALTIRKSLVADYPENAEFCRNLAFSHNNMGILLRETRRLKEAETALTDALAIYKQLVAKFPARHDYLQDLAGAQTNFGQLLLSTNRPKKAEEACNAALAIYKQLAAKFPTRPEFQQELAACYNNLGYLLSAVERPKDAEEAYQSAIAIYKRLTDDFTDRRGFRQELAAGYNNLGSLLSEAGRAKEAEIAYTSALVIRKRLVDELPNRDDLRNALAGTFVNLAQLQQLRGDGVAAKQSLLESRPHHLAALKIKPKHPTYRRFYRNHLSVLTAVHAGLLEKDDAVRIAETCRDLGWNPPGDAYDAACLLCQCIPIVAKHADLNEQQRRDAEGFYGDAAMKLLRDAAAKGFDKVAHMKKDTDLDPLRRRDDFKKFIAELEAKRK